MMQSDLRSSTALTVMTIIVQRIECDIWPLTFRRDISVDRQLPISLQDQTRPLTESMRSCTSFEIWLPRAWYCSSFDL